MPLVEYSQSRCCSLSTLPYTNVAQLQDYFNVNDVNLKISKYTRLSHSLNHILNAINTHDKNLWFGLQLFNDYAFQPQQPGPDWRYYISKFQLPLQQSHLIKVNTVTVILNFLRTVLPLMLRTMAIYMDDKNYDLIMRPLIHVELTGSELIECRNTQIVPKGFSKMVHFRVVESKEEVVVMAGYTQAYLQAIYLAITFRELNFKRLKIDPEISLETLDSLVEHLIQVIRKMANTNDYNLYGKGVKAVFETYLQGERMNNVDKIKERLEEHRRLLLLYECQYARVSAYNTTLMGKLNDLVSQKDLLYEYLSTIIFNSEGLTLDDDLSYCCFMQHNHETQQILTMIAVEKKTNQLVSAIPLEAMLSTITTSLTSFLQKYPEICDKFSSSPQTLIHQGSPSKFRPNFKYMQMSKGIMLSRLKREEGELIPFFPKITNNHFHKEYARLQLVFGESRESSEYVETLIFQIMKNHKKRNQRNVTCNNPQKPSKKLNTTSSSINSNKSRPGLAFFLKMGLAKSLKIISDNEYNLLNLMDRCKDTQNEMISILIECNPFIHEKTLNKLTELICLKYIKSDYTAFTVKNSLDPVRSRLLYRFLSAVGRSHNVRHTLNLESLDIDEELLILISSSNSRETEVAYYTMVQKITQQVFKEPNCRILDMLLKVMELQLKQVSLQPSIYAFLGGIYVEVLMGGVDQPLRAQPINNDLYKNQNLSQLTNQIKKEKILELVVARGVQAESMTIQKFFDSFKPMSPSQECYEIYKDFTFSNYDLLTFVEEISKPPSISDQALISKFFVESEFRGRITPKGFTTFSFFLSDIQDFALPSTEEEMYLAKTHLLNKTLSSSRLVKDLYVRNPETKLAGIPIKQVFDQSAKEDEADLYDRNVVAQKVFGISLLEAQQHFNLFVNLESKYKNYERLSEQEKGFFNETVQRVLSKEGKLRSYIERTLDLGVYLDRLSRQ